MHDLKLDSEDALLVVDVQRDFCPGGALPVEGGDEVVPVLNDLIRRATEAGALVVASRDWHPLNHVSFEQRGGPWPVHCVENSEGAEFHPDLDLPGNVVIFSKGDDPDRDAYSAFDGTDLAEYLDEHDVERLFVGGLAEDVCVRATVLDALRHGFETHLIADATRPVDPEDGARAIEEMEANGAVIEAGIASRAGR